MAKEIGKSGNKVTGAGFLKVVYWVTVKWRCPGCGLRRSRTIRGCRELTSGDGYLGPCSKCGTVSPVIGTDAMEFERDGVKHRVSGNRGIRE